jgi:hypothetical protein
MSKESLITSSTSNGNIKYNSNFSINKKIHNLSDVSHSYGSEPLNNFGSKNNMNSSSTSNYINIKFSISFGNKIIYSSKNLTKNNYKEQSPISSKDDDIIFDKEKDIFNDDDFTITESDISKINPKQKFLTSSKKSSNKIKFKSGKQSKKNIRFNISQSPIEAEPEIELDNINEKLTIRNTVSNSKAISPIRKTTNKSSKKYLNVDIKMKTSIGFNKRKNIFDKNILENKYKNKIIKEIPRKLNSCENIIEDEILDQNFKNYLKNDEILKANLSRNNSLNNLIQNNNNDIKDTNRCQKTCCSNFNSSLSQSTRCNIIDNFETYNKKNSKKINKTIITQELNDNHLYNSSLQLFRNNDEYNSFLTEILPNNNFKRIKTNKNFEENITLMNTDENFERLKIDFLLLYSNENIKKINNDDLFLELQLMIEKILTLQDKHQKEYIGLFNSININKNVSQNYENKYISLIKKINKLSAKKIFIDIKDKRKELYNENKINFINTRSKIMNKGEFIIWRKMMEKSSKSKIGNNNKNKITNIFLTICRKHENILNKLSFKFYKEIKNKQIKKNANNSSKKINKFYSNTFFSERKGLNKNMRISETESNMQYLNTNMQNIKKLNSNSKIKKYSKISKKNTKIDVKDISNSNNNNINFGTMVYESSTNKIYCNTKKINKCKKKSSSISDKSLHKKKGANKSQ